MSGSSMSARWRALVARVGLTRAEVAALAVLGAGAIAALGLLWWVSRPEALPAGERGVVAVASASDEASAEVVVHVAGAVATPGLQRLPAGARVADAIAAAGGSTADAATERVNLARTLVDGEQLVVPDARDPPAATAAVDDAVAAASQSPQRFSQQSPLLPDGRLDLNRATLADLDALPGIGPVLAERILQHREEAGGFASVAELREVSGIGERRYLELAELVGVAS